MSQSTMQFITQRKLQELNRQRTRLRDAYREVEQAAGQADSEIERLRRLYDGLRALKLAGQPLHPDAANLEILFYEAEAGVLSPEVLSLWRERMEQELRAGQTRAEFVYLFGALLEEWTRPSPPDARLAAERREARQQLLQEAVRPPEPTEHQDLMASLFGRSAHLQALRNRLRDGVPAYLTGPPDTYEVANILKRLMASVYHSPGLRKEAWQFSRDAALRKELTDALTLLFAERDTWRWPPEGLRPRVLWTRNKWRLYLDHDLPTFCLLEILGERWQRFFSTGTSNIQLSSLLSKDEEDPFTDDEESPFEGDLDAEDEEDDNPWNSILYLRSRHRSSLRRLNRGTDYGAYAGGGNRAIPLVQAEIQLARAAFPDRPLYVLKLDLQDFYARIPHDVLLTMLTHFGLPEPEQQFIARFLQPTLQINAEETASMQRGLLTAHTFSDLLAHLLMCLLEEHTQQGDNSLQIIRIVDDICLLTSDANMALTAWRRIEAFCEACGLQINPEKSGAVCLGGTLPEGLPTSLPRWAMLELNAQGEWQVHQETFETHLQQSRERVAAAAPLLSRAQVYNANARYLLAGLGLGFSLGETHRQSVMQAVRRFHSEFFGPEQSIVANLRTELRARFLQDAETPTDIPDAWLYWPVTAGGMGLQNPVVIAGQYHEAWQQWKRPAVPRTRPKDWEKKDNAWSTFYSAFLQPLEPVSPAETRIMQTLIEDFIARGADISTGEQQSLTPYWRWILTLYGPQILARFGTFRFLITELVPLQLIHLQRLEDTSLDDTDPSSSPEST